VPFKSGLKKIMRFIPAVHIEVMALFGHIVFKCKRQL